MKLFTYGHCMPGDYACAVGEVCGISECRIFLHNGRLYSEGICLLILHSLLAGKNVGLISSVV